MEQILPSDFGSLFAEAPGGFPAAFALPGGFIFMTRGILAHFNSEAEMASVLGHEIGHVAERHAAARQAVQGTGLFAWLRMIHVAGYGRDTVPKVIYAPRRVCRSCHQNGEQNA